MPKLTWKHDDAGDRLRLTVSSDRTPKFVRLWVADAATRDFRKSTWTERELKLDGKSAVGEVDRPTRGWRTIFGEYEFEDGGQTYYLSTQLRMTEAKR
jgi:PhoPQ-activated pathogenicity-related protein